MNILVGYDGSNAASEALKLAKNYAKTFDAKIMVVKSVTSHHPLDPDIFQAAVEKIEREIQNQFNGDITSYEIRLLVSSRSSGENLVWFAEQSNISKIIIGIRKRSKVGKLLLGSTAQYVILHAPCPVITIK